MDEFGYLSGTTVEEESEYFGKYGRNLGNPWVLPELT